MVSPVYLLTLGRLKRRKMFRMQEVLGNAIDAYEMAVSNPIVERYLFL
jgi:hypothetical protein